MAKMTLTGAVDVIQKSTTSESITALLMECTKAVMTEAYAELTGERYSGSQKRNKKADLAAEIAQRIMIARENEAFQAQTEKEKLEVLRELENVTEDKEEVKMTKTSEFAPASEATRKLKHRVMKAHREAVMKGKMETAWLLLKLLHKGKVSLGTSPSSAEAENILTNLGCKVFYSQSYGTARIYLREEEDYAARHAEEGIQASKDEEKATFFCDLSLKEKYAELTRMPASEASCYVSQCSESEAAAMTRMLDVNSEHYRASSEHELLSAALQVRDERERIEKIIKDGENVMKKIVAELRDKPMFILAPLARESGLDVKEDTSREEVKVQLAWQYVFGVSETRQSASTLPEVSAGVEKYESGKLAEGELSELLSRATAETLREYILKEIVSEKGRNNAA